MMTTTGPAANSTPRFALPRSIWIVTAVVLTLVTWLQLGAPTGDRGMDNVLSFGLLLVAALTMTVWFVFFSAYRRRVRFLSMAAGFVAIAALLGLFRIDGFSGAMLPRFVPRWRPPADTRLATPALAGTPEAPIDMTTTTPWDFPQFLGPDRDLSIDAVTLARDWEARPPELLWHQNIGAGWAGISVVNGYAVTMEQRGDLEMITCYDIETGELVWSHAIDNRFESVIAGTGPRATPTIDDGIVYALTNSGLLLALDGGTGEPLWQRDLRADYGGSAATDAALLPYGRANSPLVVGRLVVVPAGGVPGRLVSLVAYDKKSGDVVWEGGNQQISMSSPAFGRLGGVEQILIVNEASVSGHDAESGAVLWEHPWPGVTSADANVSQAVPLPPDRVFVSKGYGLGGALLRLIPGSGGQFEVEELWHSPRVLRTKLTNVTIHEGHVFGLSDGILECVDLESGERVWKHGRYGHGQILRVHDLLIVLSEDGEVLLIEASAEQHDSVLGRFQALSGTTWNNFALYGPYLMIRNAEEAAVYRLPLET